MTTLSATGESPFAFISRRTLLKLGLGAGGALLVAGGSVAGLLALRGEAPTVEGLGLLTAHEYRTAAALARTHIPRGGAFELGAEDVDLARAFDTFLQGEPPKNVADLKSALMLVELGPVLFDMRATTFSNLPDADQLEHWRGWAVSGLLIRRQAAIAFRKFFSVVFFDRPEVWPHIGYPGPAVLGGGQ